MTEEDLESFRILGDSEADGDEFEIEKAFRAKGCSACHDTGYAGRTVVGEIMVVNDEIKELVVQGAPLSKLKVAALKNGMVPLQTSAIRKVKDTITSIEEMKRVIG